MWIINSYIQTHYTHSHTNALNFFVKSNFRDSLHIFNWIQYYLHVFVLFFFIFLCSNSIFRYTYSVLTYNTYIVLLILLCFSRIYFKQEIGITLLYFSIQLHLLPFLLLGFMIVAQVYFPSKLNFISFM